MYVLCLSVFPDVILTTFLLGKCQLHNHNEKIKLVYYDGLKEHLALKPLSACVQHYHPGCLFRDSF